MPAFRYKAIDAAGRFVAGELDAADPREATLRLEQLGYMPLETASGSAAPQASGSMFSFRRSVTRREITAFLRELALVLRAGLPLDEALHLLAGEESAGLAAVARDLRAAITAGASFAEALKPYPRIFGPDLVAMVRVAEASGKLDSVLESVAEERAKMEQLIDKVSSSLRYPAFLLIASVGVLVFFLVVVVPQFASVIRDFGQAPEGLVGVVLAASDFLLAHGSTMAAGLAALLLIGLLVLRRPAARKALKQQLSRLPGLRGILELRRTVLFCSSLGTLLGNGVTLTEALRVLVDLPSGEGLDKVMEAVRRGGRFVEALGRNAYLPPLAVKMLRVGEESGELAVVARRTSEFYEAKLSDRLDRIAGVVGPAAIVVIATIIGGLIVSILSALLSVNQLVT